MYADIPHPPHLNSLTAAAATAAIHDPQNITAGLSLPLSSSSLPPPFQKSGWPHATKFCQDQARTSLAYMDDHLSGHNSTSLSLTSVRPWRFVFVLEEKVVMAPVKKKITEKEKAAQQSLKKEVK